MLTRKAYISAKYALYQLRIGRTSNCLENGNYCESTLFLPSAMYLDFLRFPIPKLRH